MMPSPKIYQWFDVADQLVSVMLRKTNGTVFANEANDIAIEYEKICDDFFDHIEEVGSFDVGEAKDLWHRMMDVQQRMIDMGDKVMRPN